jgi:peptidoglycan/xylan/chitin deacetylase (PgdA/CDA1 family)
VRERGHEIGVHGLQHTGKLFSSRAEFEARAPRINAYVRDWGVTGFRSPATYRNPFWLPELDVDHDSSYMDNATCEPQRGGVCAPFPFMLSERLVELPISLPMDHTLINILRQDVIAACTAKVDWVRRQHGLAVALFHPDYNTTEASRERYGALLDVLAADATGWGALPHEIAAWWQRRRRSQVELRDGAPVIVGPAAAEARIWWACRDGDRVRWTL